MTVVDPQPQTAAPAKLIRPELLAPAGDWDCARAAVENGADAIYFGLERFNARMRAHNFTVADLPKLMDFLHRRGVRGYVTFNTLVFTPELDEAEDYLRSIIAAGVDAAIVQDVGICRLIRALSPDFPIHASTQMTITSATGVEFARELGCSLVVLARECSIAEIEKIRASETAIAAATAMPIEVFVHGALCVAYSGQCLTSEALGGRSANRGECAQACRMPYELISDGKTVPLGDKRYLLSPQDLAGLPVLPDLIRSGVASLKIEGRLKTAEYVANITRVYREALDRTMEGLPFETPASRYDLEMGFSRGLYTGWFCGIHNQELAHARFGKKRGVYLGEVTRVQRDRVFIRLEGALKPGDGVVFDAGRPDQKEEGGRIYTIAQNGADSALSFGDGAVDFNRVHVGDKLWKTSDPELDRRVRQTFAGGQPRFQRPLHFEVHGAAGLPLTVIARDDLGHIAQAESQTPLAIAEKHSLTVDKLREQLGRLGGTPFRAGEVTSRLEGDLMLPVSELNRLRRELAAEVERQRALPKRWQLNSARWTELIHAETKPAQELDLIVLCRNLPQIEAALSSSARTIYCDFEDPKRYREAVHLFRSLAPSDGERAAVRGSIWVAPPRIFKMGEEWILNQVRSCEADGWLVRNYDHLKFFAGQRCRGDFSFNVANPITAEYFIHRFGLEHITASYDLNAAQLEGLLKYAPPNWFEITIHQHMPMFHMEHCVFCAFLSSGKDYRDCGRPCDKHEVKLRDRVGAEHPLKADAGCRNTVYNSQAQTGAEHALRFLHLGVRNFRIEFVNETPDHVARTIALYQQLFRQEITASDLWRELKLANQLGVTRGQINRAG